MISSIFSRSLLNSSRFAVRSYSGNSFSERENALENAAIRKHERETLEALRKKLNKDGAPSENPPAASTSAPSSSSKANKSAKEELQNIRNELADKLKQIDDTISKL